MKLPVTDDALDDKDALTFLKGRAAVAAPFLTIFRTDLATFLVACVVCKTTERREGEERERAEVLPFEVLEMDSVD
jgi:hypothetical protein